MYISIEDHLSCVVYARSHTISLQIKFIKPEKHIKHIIQKFIILIVFKSNFYRNSSILYVCYVCYVCML